MVSRRSAALSLAAALAAPSAPRSEEAAIPDGAISGKAFADLPACKKGTTLGPWELVVFAGVYGMRQQTENWATFGVIVEDGTDKQAAVDVSRQLKERLISEPALAAKAVEATAIELRSGGETKRLATDLQRLLEFREFRIANVDYIAEAEYDPELTGWLFERALSGADFEFALLVGSDGEEVGADMIPMAGYGEAVDTAERWSAELSIDARETRCDPTKKVVCSAMNRAYGFGAFRNAIWLRYSERRLTAAHERGYHALALPIIAVAYGSGSRLSDPWRRALRTAMEHMARERTADLWAEMRGGRRRPLGAFYRAVLEPLCWAVGCCLAESSRRPGAPDLSDGSRASDWRRGAVGATSPLISKRDAPSDAARRC